MNLGMLWFDNDPNTDLPTKVDKAATYYHTKYSRIPNMAFVHPKDYGERESLNVNGVTVKANRSVMPCHIWIGVEA